MLPRTFSLGALPFYAEPNLYFFDGFRLRGWEFSGWKAESMSWKTGCYIHAGLSGPVGVFRGPDLDLFFSEICTNSFAKFSVGTMKHAVMCTEHGLIATHGILQRSADDEARFFAAGNWPNYMLSKTSCRVSATMEDIYLFQVAGPQSLATLERATGECLADIAFLRFRKARIAGLEVEIGRIGMSGNLAYEVRGPIGEGPDIYESICRAGADFGVERLGWRTYLVNHVEGGFPQQLWTFYPALLEDVGYREFAGANFRTPPTVTGSVDPADMRARYRNPLELGWSSIVKFNHDFVGRSALESIAASPHRTIATLKWNVEDVLDVQASLYRDGEEYKTLDLPTCPTWKEGFLAHADHISVDGQRVGYSSGTIYSYYFRSQLSMACIDVRFATPGTEVIVEWGDYGRRIKPVRATIERYPYLTEARNDALDAAKPSVAAS